MKDIHQKESRKLSQKLHHFTVSNQILKLENKGLRETFLVKKKHRKQGKPLDLQQRQEYRSAGVLWSPRKTREVVAREAVRERLEMEQKLEKARAKKEREELHLQRQLQVEERRVERERLKKVREKEKADKAAERQRQREERDSARALQLSQKRKRKASRPPTLNARLRKRVGNASQSDQVLDQSSAPPPKVTTRGRNVKLPQKFR